MEKKYSIEENAKEYLDKCEEIYKKEKELLHSIIEQCSSQNLEEIYRLTSDTSDFNKNI